MPAELDVILAARETERRAALVASDMTRLADVIADDIIHVHTTGQVHDKAALIDHAGSVLEFLAVDRGPLLIRPLGDDAAIMTGTMTNTVRRRGTDERVTVRAFVTQVWARREGRWQVASFHAVRLPDNKE